MIVGKKMDSDAVIRRERLADLPDDPTARVDAIRRQASRRRRHRDYLLRGELVVLMWSGLAAFCAAAAGVVAIAVGGSDRKLGVLLTSSAAGGLLIWFACC